jgi:hypothetical protein
MVSVEVGPMVDEMVEYLVAELAGKRVVVLAGR